MSLETFATCLIAVTLLTLTPGVDTMLIIRNSARGGWWDGAVSSLGICSGLYLHAAVSALGISLILLQTAWLFMAIKIAGACYLFWLGISSWLRVYRGSGGIRFTEHSVGKSELMVVRSFREGFLSNVLNPKTIVFYMAFLPQFIDPQKGSISQALIVASTHFTVAMIYQCLLASMINKARVWLAKPSVSRIFDSLTGTVMMYLGLRLAIDR